MAEKETKTTRKRTKADIAEDYESLKSRLEEMEGGIHADKNVEEIIRKEEKGIVERASGYSVEFVVKNLSELGLHIGKALGGLTEKMTDEARKLTELHQAIEIEQRHLEEVRNIKVVADALSLMMQDYEAKKSALQDEIDHKEEAFRQQMEHKRKEWEREQAVHDEAVKEKDARVARERDREKEDYDYALTLNRKKDKDAYELQKAALQRALKEERTVQEKELTAREEALASQEGELAELKKKVEAFQATLDQAVKKATDEVARRVEEKAQQEAKLLAKEVEGDKNLQQLQIKNLQEQQKRQEVEMGSLAKQLAEANRQVMTIATQAIEGASGAKTLGTVQEIAMEQARVGKSQKQ